MSELITEKEINTLVNNEYAGLPAIKDPVMKRTVKAVIENTLKGINEDEYSPTRTGDMAQYTPVIISLIRRTLPTLVGPQMVGMQAMNLPTGRIFVQRVYAVKEGVRQEVWGSGPVGTQTAQGPEVPFAHSGPFTTQDGEALGWDLYDSQYHRNLDYAPTTEEGKTGPAAPFAGSRNNGGDWNSDYERAMTNASSANYKGTSVDEGPTYPEMAFGIESMDVSVKTRALKGRLTTEVVQDLRSVHGLDAEQEIANILQTEITAEIDREIVNRIIFEAKAGAQNCTTPGVFSFAVDSDGRWSMEKVMGLLIQIEREATWIAQETRRGRGNFILTSPEIAATLSMANLITTQFDNVNFTPVVNPVGVSYYGMLANRFKVFVDPYMTYEAVDGQLQHTLIVGYKGASQYDAGLFYCPYIPVQWYRTTGQEDFGARIGIKTRYGLVSNPYSITPTNLRAGQVNAVKATNSFYRKIRVVL